MNAQETIQLDFPVKSNGREITELVIRRPKVRDIEIANKIGDDLTTAITLIANLAEITPDEVRLMDAGDFQKASDLLEGFLG